jgi:hypothetical protein
MMGHTGQIEIPILWHAEANRPAHLPNTSVQHELGFHYLNPKSTVSIETLKINSTLKRNKNPVYSSGD